MSTTPLKNYHDWLRDAHAMEEQAETMLDKMAKRLDNYPELIARLKQHIEETREQKAALERLMDSHNISHSTLKDTMGKMGAMGQAMGGMFTSDEVVKGAIANCAFEQFEVANYTALIKAAEMVGDQEGVRILTQIREEEMRMAEWCSTHLPTTTERFLLRSADPDAEAKK